MKFETLIAVQGTSRENTRLAMIDILERMLAELKGEGSMAGCGLATPEWSWFVNSYPADEETIAIEEEWWRNALAKQQKAITSELSLAKS